MAIYAPVCYAADDKRPNDLLLWYDVKPNTVRGVKEPQPLPIGNGLIGALVYGSVSEDRIALNETSFWSGAPHDYNDPEAGNYYKPIQDLLVAGQFKAAEKMADEHFYGKPAGQAAYQPLGAMNFIHYGIDDDKTTRYYRDLDMLNGITSVSFTDNGVNYKREVFVSYPDKVLVMQITADKPGKISFDVSLDSHFTDNITAVNGKLTLDGAWENTLPSYWLMGEIAEKGMTFQTVLQVKNDGGQSGVYKNRLTIRKANSAVLILTAHTSHVTYKDISGHPAARNQPVMDAAAGKDYATLRSRHVADFSSLMGRVGIDVGDKLKNEKTITQRIAAVNNGESDPNLEALCFQWGRYMLVSSSRAGGQASTLQAIWNERLTPPWGSKYTININTQMNYWLAEVANLGECHIPLIDMVKDLAENGVKTARIYYPGSKGWVTHHNVDLWRGTAPVDMARYGMWPVGGAWLCQHLWEHYAFSNGDREILKDIYPALKGSAEFLSSILVKHHTDGYLVTPVSMSPEHGYYFDDSGAPAFLTQGPTMDIGIMRELFAHVIEAGKILHADAALGKQLEAILPQLPPYKVNQLGYVREWVEDWTPQRGGHDVSPYFPFYPGSSVLLRRESDREIVAAYRYWLESRGLRGGGFPGAWNICMWARMERGDRTGALIQSAVAGSAESILRQGTGAQVDGPFGFAAGVAESLVQSHAGEISLLPALPASWQAKGEATGLRARAGYEVTMKWEKGKLITAEITHPDGGVCQVRYNGKVVKATVPKGRPFIINEK
jgi:alpha-L-fucosidase 2